MVVPGEYAVMKIRAEKGKVPEIDWIRGGTVAHDYWRLYYEQVDPAEAAYRQLTMTNMLEGGDIRDYKEEFDAYMQANKQTIMAFVRANPRSYISLMNLLEHYNWFDENGYMISFLRNCKVQLMGKYSNGNWMPAALIVRAQ